MKYSQPNKDGMFGKFGGRFVPEELDRELNRVEKSYQELKTSKVFQSELMNLHYKFTGRPNPLYSARNLTIKLGGAKIYLKREDLNHTGAHKINNALGQALVAKHMGATKLIAETGAGQHGVAVATVAAKFGMECEIYMGARDIANQNMNVYRMQMLGARVHTVTQGRQTLKDAVDAALQAFASQKDAFYMLGSAVGPHPYPLMVRDFQSIIGIETKRQILKSEHRLPDAVVACVGGGSNAIGIMYPFIKDEHVKLIAVEPAGKGADTDKHGLALQKGKPGTIHGFKCYILQDSKGNIKSSYSAASGLDYPGVGPELSHLKDIGRLSLKSTTDSMAVKAMAMLANTEGIIPALESAHAIAFGAKLAKQSPKDTIIVINLSGRGDKDVKNVVENHLPNVNNK